jgi:ribosomal protein L35AE/L33A
LLSGDMVRALTVVHQIMIKFKGARSEDVAAKTITNLVVYLKKQNGPYNSYDAQIIAFNANGNSRQH